MFYIYSQMRRHPLWLCGKYKLSLLEIWGLWYNVNEKEIVVPAPESLIC